MIPAYLTACLTLTGCYLVGFLMLRRHRAGSLLSAVLITPFGVLGAVFVPTYWRPDHVFEFFPGFGPEDLIFCFACGGLSWLAAAGGSGASWDGRLARRHFLARFGAWTAGSLVLVWAVRQIGLGTMAAFLWGFCGSGAWAAWRRPPLLRLVLPGAIGFAGIFVGVAWLVLRTHPACAGFWTSGAICGHRLWGLPVEEIAWALSFGGIWPVVLGSCLDGELHWEHRSASGLAGSGGEGREPVGILGT